MYPTVYYQFQQIIKIAKVNMVKQPQNKDYYSALIAELEAGCLEIETFCDADGRWSAAEEISEIETEEELLKLVKSA